MTDPVGLPIVDQITVYGADWCGDCRRARRFLVEAGTPFRWVDVAADEAARTMLKEAGYPAIPVVLVPGRAPLMEPSNDDLAAAIVAAPRAGPAASAR